VPDAIKAAADARHDYKPGREDEVAESLLLAAFMVIFVGISLFVAYSTGAAYVELAGFVPRALVLTAIVMLLVGTISAIVAAIRRRRFLAEGERLIERLGKGDKSTDILTEAVAVRDILEDTGDHSSATQLNELLPPNLRRSDAEKTYWRPY
jgi:hypothetical protein